MSDFIRICNYRGKKVSFNKDNGFFYSVMSRGKIIDAKEADTLEGIKKAVDEYLEEEESCYKFQPIKMFCRPSSHSDFTDLTPATVLKVYPEDNVPVIQIADSDPHREISPDGKYYKHMTLPEQKEWIRIRTNYVQARKEFEEFEFQYLIEDFNKFLQEKAFQHIVEDPKDTINEEGEVE